MSATLSIVNSFSTTVNGSPQSAQQGAAGNTPTDEFDITLAGRSKVTPSILATASIIVIYDDSVDTQLSDLYYLWVKADQPFYIQLITAATSVTIGPLAANVPISIGAYATLKILGAAATTAIAGGAEPSTTDVKKVVLGNYSGTNANFTFAGFL